MRGCAPDESVFKWLAPRLDRRRKTEDEKSNSIIGNPVIRRDIAAGALYPDADAAYSAIHHYEASQLEPYVACPHRVDNVKPLSQVRGTKIQQAFLGTCTNGRIEDLQAAAEIIRGKKLARGTRMLVIPASSQVLSEAMARGYIQTFVDAGAVIGVPGCGPCMGNHMGMSRARRSDDFDGEPQFPRADGHARIGNLFGESGSRCRKRDCRRDCGSERGKIIENLCPCSGGMERARPRPLAVFSGMARADFLDCQSQGAATDSRADQKRFRCLYQFVRRVRR